MTQNKSNHPWSVAIVQAMKLKAAREVGRRMRAKVKPQAQTCPPMTRNESSDFCERCGAPEVDAMTPRTVYACGSSDYDKRPGTFKRGDNCKP